MKILKNITYAENPSCVLDCYFPEAEGFSTVVHFHGGGLESGDKTDCCCAEIAVAAAEAGIGFVSANYRMYPDAKFPEFLQDGAAAVKWAKENAVYHGGNGKVYVFGQSAGAYISLMLCFDGRYLGEAGLSPTEIDGWLIDSAQPTTHFNVLRERGEDSRLQRIDEAAPLFYVNEKSRFSHVLLVFYENDMPVRYEQNMLFYKAVKNFNPDANIEIRVLGGGHCEASTVKKNGAYPIEEILFSLVK